MNVPKLLTELEGCITVLPTVIVISVHILDELEPNKYFSAKATVIFFFAKTTFQNQYSVFLNYPIAGLQAI